MQLTTQQIARFRATVLDYYQHHGRNTLPWRQPTGAGQTKTYDAYAILVSELMLQQTQVARVIPKYEAWMARFTDVASLANAELAEVLRLWIGLGYNRRAKYLWQAAHMIEHDFGGAVPSKLSDLIRLPGVGKNTAGAVIVYAYNTPVVFIETNIRTVFIHHFFADHDMASDPNAGSVKISDAALADLVAQTLPRHDVRDWYWALMDYGSMLKSTGNKSHTGSKSYTKQSKFLGSDRQIRGTILRSLATAPRTTAEFELIINDDRLGAILSQLTSEQLIKQKGDVYLL